MARTVAQVLDSAYVTLVDDIRARYSEAASLGFVVDALNMIRNVRPDLFVGQYGTDFAAVTTASVLPINDQFFRPVVDYVIARHETMDDELVNNGRATLMASLAQGFLR